MFEMMTSHHQQVNRTEVWKEEFRSCGYGEQAQQRTDTAEMVSHFSRKSGFGPFSHPLAVSSCAPRGWNVKNKISASLASETPTSEREDERR